MNQQLSKPRTTRAELQRQATERARAAFQAVEQGASIRQAAKEHHVGRERLSAFIRDHAEVDWKPGTKLVITSNRLVKEARIFSKGRMRTVMLYPEELSRAMKFMSAVGRFLNTNDPLQLKGFQGKSVTDVSGKRHPLETSPNRLYEISAANDLDVIPLYKDVV